MKTLRKHSAFALSELLIVAAVLSILSALLFSVFARARANAKRTSCQSNLKQIGVAWLQYSRDYDGQMMLFSTGDGNPSPANPVRYWWGGANGGATYHASQGLLSPYLKSVATYNCPSFTLPVAAHQGPPGYGYNADTLSPTNYGAAPNYAATARASSLNSLGNAARTVAFADAAQLNAKGKLRPSTYLSKPSDDYPNFHARHQNTGNVLFCDGHIQLMRPVYRTGQVGYLKTPAEALRANHLGDIDDDGDLGTDELFNGTGKP